MDYPFVYRVHGEPNEEKIGNFLKFVSILGYIFFPNKIIEKYKILEIMLVSPH